MTFFDISPRSVQETFKSRSSQFRLSVHNKDLNFAGSSLLAYVNTHIHTPTGASDIMIKKDSKQKDRRGEKMESRHHRLHIDLSHPQAT